TYNTTNQCTATLSAFAPCADKVGWQHWKTVYNGVDYAGSNSINWSYDHSVQLRDMPTGLSFHFRLIVINGITTTIGTSYGVRNGESFKEILSGINVVETGVSDCNRYTTLMPIVQNGQYFQWYYPNNSSVFGVNAGQKVSSTLGGNLQNFSFPSNINWTQYKKTPWKVNVSNICFKVEIGTNASVSVPNWCEICSTTPLFLCSNSAREETETSEIAPNLSSKTIIYPNPTERILNIESPENIQKIVLFDVQGKEIAAYLPNEKKYVLDLQNINEGLYFVRIQTVLNTVETFKVQINR
ncbi:MAG: T9SS C-terminal target domain-containing protein, partial [Cytophagales bacterium]